MSNDTSRAYWLEDGRMISGTAEAFFASAAAQPRVISLVGGGGKTTLLHYLARRFAGRGLRTAVMTTTKIGCPQDCCETMQACLARWAQGEYAVCGRRDAAGSLREPEGAFLQALLASADRLIIEADGARRKPCKAPQEGEPVILPQTDTVVCVMGIDALGGAVQDVCHRPKLVMQLLGCGEDHLLTQEDMAALILSAHGGRKGVGARRFIAVINKCDDENRRNGAETLLRLLHARGQAAVMTAGMGRSEAYEPHPQG